MVTAVKGVDPRVKRTRKLLQQAFLELFQEKGFAAISIQDITERATVNRATFYAHFQDKYALLDSIIREQCQLIFFLDTLCFRIINTTAKFSTLLFTFSF